MARLVGGLVVFSVLSLVVSSCTTAALKNSEKASRRHTADLATTTSTTTSTTSTTTTSTTVPAPRAAPATSAPACPSGLASRLSSTGSAAQVVTVDGPSYSTTYATLTAWGRQGTCWVPALGPWPARIGASGFSDHKSEGDNTTPTGAYAVGSVMYGNAGNPGVGYSYHQLVCGDWWDEDPSSPQYNTFQHVPCGQTPPFGGDSEALWQETAAYPSFAVVDYNTGPITPGAGSAIFIHADVGGPTAGCVSLPLGELDALLRWLSPAASPLVVMGPDSEIARF